MIKRVFFTLFSIGMIGCWYSPAVSSKYDFRKVGRIDIKEIKDHSNLLGSGKMVQSSLSHNFLKYGFDVTESNIGNPIVSVGDGNKALELSCIITEFTESEVIVIPYHHIDRGYTKTTIDHSTEEKKNNKKAEISSSSTTTTHGGIVSQGSRIEYTQTRVVIMFKIRDKDSGKLVWSNSYWYSGLELHRTKEICVKNGIHH